MTVAHGMNKKFYVNIVQLTFLVFLKEMIDVLNFNPSFPNSSNYYKKTNKEEEGEEVIIIIFTN